MHIEFAEMRHQDPKTKTYLGSPNLVRLSDGALLATHDYFGPGSPHSSENEEFLASVYRSEDSGKTWQCITHLAGVFWSSLFVHREDIYLLGTNQAWGSIVIRRSSDGGFSWTHPSDHENGLLCKGGFYHDAPNYHGAPVPVVHANGRIYRAFEDLAPWEWGPGFHAFVLSADENADLLKAASWTMSNQVPLKPEWLPDWGKKFENTHQNVSRPGWLEGNVVKGPDGQLYNILRFNAEPFNDKAALLHLSPDGTRLEARPDFLFIDMPGGCHKFTIRRDPKSGKYLTLSNHNTVPRFTWQRNNLSLSASKDLRDWKPCSIVWSDGERTATEESLLKVGYQYVDWIFDGDDIIGLVRVADGEAPNFHDSNRIVFIRIKNYSELLPHD